jgi:hypothetical protein
MTQSVSAVPCSQKVSHDFRHVIPLRHGNNAVTVPLFLPIQVQ